MVHIRRYHLKKTGLMRWICKLLALVWVNDEAHFEDLVKLSFFVDFPRVELRSESYAITNWWEFDNKKARNFSS